jgi:hypothetical protein
MKKTKKTASTVKHEIVVRVDQNTTPTTSDLSEPLRDGRKLTIPKTWLTGDQLVRMVEKTPPQHVYKRPGKGGGTFDYVTISYVQRVLDYVFGWNWDFEIIEHGKESNHVWVLGKLTVRSADGKHTITKTQFGRSDVKQLKSGGNLDYGNDLKGASSDALKKCASMLGIARDIYGKTDYKQESGKDPANVPTQPKPTAPVDGPVKELYCHGASRSGCPDGNEITEEESNFSKKLWGKALCRNCQKVAPRK